MLTKKQKNFLRGESHGMRAILQIGKSGVTSNLIRQVQEALEARELIKVSILPNVDRDKYTVAAELAEATGSEIVQLIGSTIVLYKPSKNKKRYDMEKLERIK